MLTQDEQDYWRASKEFVRVLIAELNQSLKQQRISKRKRREICRSYVFSLANLFDQQWVKVRGKTRYPLLCFTHRFVDVDTATSDLPDVAVPHRAVELHGMVHDEVDWYFDEAKETDNSVTVGSVGEETPDFEIFEDEVTGLITPPCWTCQGTGQCFCLRKGNGDPTSCPRCQGSGHCQHCAGTGRSRHP